MPQGDKWHSLLTVNENKTDLIPCFAEYLKVKSLAYFYLNIPITITEGENTIRIDQTGWSYLDICIMKRLIVEFHFHCIIVSKDTEVFLLLCKCKSQKTWYMKYDNDKYVDIPYIFEYTPIPSKRLSRINA